MWERWGRKRVLVLDLDIEVKSARNDLVVQRGGAETELAYRCDHAGVQIGVD